MAEKPNTAWCLCKSTFSSYSYFVQVELQWEICGSFGIIPLSCPIHLVYLFDGIKVPLWLSQLWGSNTDTVSCMALCSCQNSPSCMSSLTSVSPHLNTKGKKPDYFCFSTHAFSLLWHVSFDRELSCFSWITCVCGCGCVATCSFSCLCEKLKLWVVSSLQPQS